MIRTIGMRCPACLKSFKIEGDYFDIGENISCFRCNAELEIIGVDPAQVRLVKSATRKRPDRFKKEEWDG
jgi:hypothetical protein